MLKFCQEILQKVSFDKFLFQKELLKSIKWLNFDEAKALKMWCMLTFGHLYMDVITQAFGQATV
jgi:hypothetical protein